MKSVFIILFLATTVLAQPFIKSGDKRQEGFYTEFNGLGWLLNESGFSIFRDSAIVYQTRISGKKLFLKSQLNKYCAVVNYGFKKDKSDYPVTVDLFENASHLNKFSFDAPYDLPHPLITLTNEGEILLFDPMRFNIVLISSQGKKEYAIDKDVDYEIERSFFLVQQYKIFYLVLNEKPLSTEEETANTYLYRMSDNFGKIEKELLPISSPVFMENIDGRVVISGAGFSAGNVFYETRIIDESGEQVIPVAFELIKEYGDGYAAKYGNTIYLLNKNFTVTASRDFGSFISDLAVSGHKLIMIIENKGWKISAADSSLTITASDGISLSGSAPRFVKTEGDFLLYDNDYTYNLNEFVRRNK